MSGEYPGAGERARGHNGPMALIDFDAITEDTLRASGAMKWAAPGEIGVFVAEMDFGLAPGVAAELRRLTDAGRAGYLLPREMRAMSQAFTEFAARRYEWELDPERVRALPDVLTALVFMLEHLIPAGSRVVLPTPAYMPFLTIAQTYGHELVQVPLVFEDGEWIYDWDALDAALAGSALLILCNPHNPVGRVLEIGELAKITELVEKHGVRVFSDEIHAPLVFRGHAHIPYASTSEAAARHTLTATSASKAWNVPGLKSAQLIFSNETDVEAWRGRGEMIEHQASTPGVIATIAAYREGEEWLDEVLAYLDETRQWFPGALAEAIPGVETTTPEGTYLALADFRPLELGEKPGAFFRRDAGVLLTDGSECGARGAGYGRINLATTRPILERVIAQMAEAVARRA